MSNRILKLVVLRILAVIAGIVLGCAVAPAAFAQSCYNNSNTNLIQNGGFEDGSVGQNIPDWSVTWNGKTSSGKRLDPFLNVEKDNPHSGNQELDMGTTGGANDITQTIKTTVAAQVYTACFWLASAPAPSVGKTSLEVLWNDVTELQLIQSGTSPYEYYSFTVVGTGLDHLRFRERNDKGYYYLDDVALQECSGCTVGPEVKKRP